MPPLGPLSTPPRKRIWSKSMTSASSSRPSALRKPKGTERERSRSTATAKSDSTCTAKSLKTELKDAVAERKSRKVNPEEASIKKVKKDKKLKKKPGKCKDDQEKSKQKTKDQEKCRDKKCKDKKVKEPKQKDKTGRDETQSKVKETTKNKKNQDKSGASEKSKKNKDPPIKFTEAQKASIEHIFTMPEKKAKRDASPPPPDAKMSTKEKALQKFQELAAHLAPSELGEEDDSDCPATDLENLMLPGAQQVTEKDSDSDEGSVSESEGQEGSEEEEEDQTDADQEEGESSSEDSEDLDGEELSEEEDEDDDGSVSKGTGKTAEVEDNQEQKAEKEKEEKKPDISQHALVPVVKESQHQVAAVRNSMTNKREWDVFNRQAKSRMPIALNSMFISQKQDLFGLWLDSQQDWQKCALEVERRQTQENISTRGWRAEQGKTIKQRYSQEKYEALCKTRISQGLYYEDPDFPGDQDEPWLNSTGIH